MTTVDTGPVRPGAVMYGTLSTKRRGDCCRHTTTSRELHLLGEPRDTAFPWHEGAGLLLPGQQGFTPARVY